MNQTFKIVADMNTAFGNPRGDLRAIDWTKLTSQCANIADEVQESYDAMAARHPNKLRDGLCDIQVFALGALHIAGYTDFTFGAVDMPRVGFYEGVDLQLTQIELEELDLREALTAQNMGLVYQKLAAIINRARAGLLNMGADPVEDMDAVVGAVMSRFCRTDDELAETREKYSAAGVEFYEEGTFPTVCLKSSKMQADPFSTGSLPQGKFLKSVAFREPVFAPLKALAA